MEKFPEFSNSHKNIKFRQVYEWNISNFQAGIIIVLFTLIFTKNGRLEAVTDISSPKMKGGKKTVKTNKHAHINIHKQVK